MYRQNIIFKIIGIKVPSSNIVIVSSDFLHLFTAFNASQRTLYLLLPVGYIEVVLNLTVIRRYIRNGGSGNSPKGGERFYCESQKQKMCLFLFYFLSFFVT